ncbi:uncharacterized protein L969DRAFT_18465 [Mixia osmundae IAM 14324]|uniref:Uncharacterized protein n=1 Tax=Mixia osmundae (strain CBS 9802 / IAM 14324 / JCM 22182 / KY 12970) TaxID=764103 RepID=G7E7P1_MIXOS|nr:uncharacterized protein L969DRAFT_18465 [Mixia osmundae IAM 14324]KEI38451.1 hypothetical protein L969DRAFT_18465 [Mixia osmundae IAM 14324]GAA98851.1 hypothetical protein E5Q_05539 [Mixia osmundae IAM 14324]
MLSVTPFSFVLLMSFAPAHLYAADSRMQLLPRAGRTKTQNNAAVNNALQTSLTLDASQIGSNIAQNGQAVAEAGQVPSLTSTNNFINFCAGTNQQITNGLQQKQGSCNPIPLGQIAAANQLPSTKFQNPLNNDLINPDETFTIKMAISNLATGQFVNADTNYFSAPAQLDAQGITLGHSHVVIQKLSSLQQTTPVDPTSFAFFKGLNDQAQNGVLSTDVTGGLPAGAYRLASITTTANHAALNGPVAQRGAFDDVVYFTVKARSSDNTTAVNAQDAVLAAKQAAAVAAQTTATTTTRKAKTTTTTTKKKQKAAAVDAQTTGNTTAQATTQATTTTTGNVGTAAQQAIAQVQGLLGKLLR